MAIDDFGTGFSSLSYLQQLPVDTIKIDQSFIATLGAESRSLSIVRAIALLGHAVGLHVTAEGIENLRQLDLLRQVGVDSGQGYLFSTPLSAEDFARTLAAWTWQPHRAKAA